MQFTSYFDACIVPFTNRPVNVSGLGAIPDLIDLGSVFFARKTAQFPAESP